MRMFESIKFEMLDYYSYVEFANVNGTYGTYYMVKEQEPNIFGMKDYMEGDFYDEFVRRYGAQGDRSSEVAEVRTDSGQSEPETVQE